MWIGCCDTMWRLNVSNRRKIEFQIFNIRFQLADLFFWKNPNEKVNGKLQNSCRLVENLAVLLACKI